MKTTNDVHQQFAAFFNSETLQPFAYLVSKRLSEGHICLPLTEVAAELNGSTYYNLDEVIANSTRLINETMVAGSAEENQPFVLHNQKLYLQRYFYYETLILNRLQLFRQTETDCQVERISAIRKHARLIQVLFEDQSYKPAEHVAENIDWQLVAAISAVLNDFTIITGGPGTGKTTTVAKILALLYTVNPDLRVALAAPTGKAAARMAESLKASAKTIPGAETWFVKLEPKTIHRLLASIPDTPRFVHNAENPVEFDVVIIDEASMIDAALFAKLLQAIGMGTRLIMLGDKDQLASVEAGSLFGDLCKIHEELNSLSADRVSFINSLIHTPARRITPEYISRTPSSFLAENIIELKRSHRFKSSEGIGKYSRAVIINEDVVLKKYLAEGGDEQVTIDTAYSVELFDNFVDGYRDFIEERNIKSALQKLNNLRVLCAVREGEKGLYRVNSAIENLSQQPKTNYKKY